MADKTTNTLAELSDEELAQKKKTLQTLLYVLWTLCALYIIYITYRLVTMEDGEGISGLAPLGGGLAVLGSTSAIVGGRFGGFKAEEKRRAQEA